MIIFCTGNFFNVKKPSSAFYLTAKNFFAKVCNEIETPTYKLQKTEGRLIKMTKKILKDEILSDAELDNVAGGSWVEFTADMLDAQKRGIAGFENLNLTDPNSDLIKMITDDKLRHQYVDKVGAVFASHGVTMQYNGKFFEGNVYTYQGKQISREQAWKIVDGK